jgi:hypothetical protein
MARVGACRCVSGSERVGHRRIADRAGEAAIADEPAACRSIRSTAASTSALMSERGVGFKVMRDAAERRERCESVRRIRRSAARLAAVNAPRHGLRHRAPFHPHSKCCQLLARRSTRRSRVRTSPNRITTTGDEVSFGMGT